VNYKRLVGLEQSMLARISPRHRNRWPELLAIDERWEACDRRQEELRMALVDLRARRERADGEYADAFARWLAAGQQEQKPAGLRISGAAERPRGHPQAGRTDTQRSSRRSRTAAFAGPQRRIAACA